MVRQDIINSVREQVGPVVDCLVPDELPESTLEKLWNWTMLLCQARFGHFFIKLDANSMGTWLNAVKQWAKFCDAVYHDGQRDKYRVTVAKVAAFIDYWTSKDRARPLQGPLNTLKVYIGTGLTHLMFLQEAVLMDLEQLQDAELKPLIPVRAVATKLSEVKLVSAELARQ